jgi:hypothetical protein
VTVIDRHRRKKETQAIKTKIKIRRLVHHTSVGHPESTGSPGTIHRVTKDSPCFPE